MSFGWKLSPVGKTFLEAHVLHSAFPEHSWVPGSSAHLWEEVVMRMKKNWDPSIAKSLSSHNPFAFHHLCTSFCRMATAGGSKRWPQGPLQSHGSRWTDGGNSVRGTKPTSWIPSFLSGWRPPCHILFFRVWVSQCVPWMRPHTLYLQGPGRWWGSEAAWWGQHTGPPGRMPLPKLHRVLTHKGEHSILSDFLDCQSVKLSDF